MAQFGFYHLTRTTPDAALPGLLEKTLAAGQRAVIRCGTPAHVAVLDKALWAADWLPHGTARTGHAALQPIWLTADDENPNAARFVFLLDGAETAPEAWERVFDLFDGTDEAAVLAARRRWTEAKNAGHALTYWKQTETGWSKS